MKKNKPKENKIYIMFVKCDCCNNKTFYHLATKKFKSGFVLFFCQTCVEGSK